MIDMYQLYRRNRGFVVILLGFLTAVFITYFSFAFITFDWNWIVNGDMNARGGALGMVCLVMIFTGIMWAAKLDVP